MGLLAQTAEPAREVLGAERIAVVADRGYFKIEDIEVCETAGLDPYLPRPSAVPRSERAGSAKMSSAMIRPVTVFSARQVIIFTPIRRL